MGSALVAPLSVDGSQVAPFYGSDVDPYTETLNRFEASLAKLSMDYVDLYLPLTPSQLACSGGYHGSRAILLLTDACSAVALKCCRVDALCARIRLGIGTCFIGPCSMRTPLAGARSRRFSATGVRRA